MIRLGQIGCGYWGVNLLRCFGQIPAVQIAGVAEVRAEQRAALAAKYPGLPTTADYHDLLGADVDAVVIATLPATHFALARDCLLAGKHVLVEKPLAMTSADAAALVELADQRGRVLMVGHTFEYNAAVRALREYVAGGEIGDPYYLYMARLNLGRVQSDMNAMWSLAPHDISILLYVLQLLPIAVSARGLSFIQPGIDDVVFLQLDFPHGIHAHIHVSWLDPNKVRQVTLVGSKKMIVYDDVSADAKIRIFDKGITRKNMQQTLGEYDTFGQFQLTLRAGDVVVPYLDFPEPLQVECGHFIDCVRSGQTPLSDGRDGLRVVRVLEAAQRSLDAVGRREEIAW